MGIEDFWEFLKRLGYSFGGPEWVEPGSVVLFDAMQVLFRYQCVAAEAVLPCDWKSHHRTKTAAMRALADTFVEAPRELVFGPEGAAGAPDMAFLGHVPEPTPVWARVRAATLRGIAVAMADCLLAGVVPVLVWDPPVAGGPREKGKVVRTGGMAMLMRAADRTWLYLALKALGVPTYVASMEGERACVASMRGGVGDCIVSTDTDAIVLGGEPVVTGPYRAVPGMGLRAEKICRYSEVLGLVGGDPRRLVDTAVFLGCDFSGRERGNGPAAAVARLGVPSYYVCEVLSRLGEGDDREECPAMRAVKFYELGDGDCVGCAVEVLGAIRGAALDGGALGVLGVSYEEYGQLAGVIGGVGLVWGRRERGEGGWMGGVGSRVLGVGGAEEDEVPLYGGVSLEEIDIPVF